MKQVIEKTILLGPLWLGVLMLSYLALHYLVIEDPYLSYGDLPFTVLNPGVRVKAGDAVRLRVSRCNSDDKTRIYLISHTLDPVAPEMQNIILPATQSSIEPGCQTSTSVVNVVPVGTRPGAYTLKGVSEVAGTVRVFSVRWESEQFEIVAP